MQFFLIEVKKKLLIIMAMFLAIIINFSCNNDKLTARIIKRDCVDCFTENTLYPDSSLVNCEASAALYIDGKICIASDKPIPNHSSVFSYNFVDSVKENTLNYYDNAELQSAIKYEDFSILPDKRTILVSTGFDRIKKDTNSWDRYNCVLYWDKDSPDKVQVLAKIDNGGVLSSVRLRPYFKKALATKQFPEGTPYFKTEGICAIPGNKLLFGVREKGANYSDFDYVFEIISVSYFFENGEIVLKNDFELIYSMNETQEKIKKPYGLSSLEYDAENERIYILTSYEHDETDTGVGGYLWYLSLTDLYEKKQPTLLKTKEGKIIQFAHKSEGIAIIDENTLFIIHDDDKRTGRTKIDDEENQFSRKKHQAAYTIVKIDE